jgi:hypothetical protein
MSHLWFLEGAIALFLFSHQSFLESKHKEPQRAEREGLHWSFGEKRKRDKHVVCSVDKAKIVIRCEVLLIDIIVHLGALHEAE